MTEPEICNQCPHPFKDHRLISFSEQAHSGVVLCPHAPCTCVATWSIHGEPVPELPDPDVLDRLRTTMFSGSGPSEAEY